jgi:hypothetical protein
MGACAMAVDVRLKLDMHALAQLSDDAVGKDLERRANRVLNGAKRRCPVDTGRLRSSIAKERIKVRGHTAYRVGTNVEYALDVHEGTGIYGHRHAVIKPKSAKFLVFTPRGSNVTVFAKQVRGVRPRPFLKEALQDART